MEERPKGVESAVCGLGGKIDKLVGELTSTWRQLPKPDPMTKGTNRRPKS
jgi:hypothetical protein